MFTYKFNLIEPDKTAQGYKTITNYGSLPFIGFSERLPLNEELDSGRITILSHNGETLPIFTIVEMLVYEDGSNAPKIIRKYYLGQDEVTTQDKMLGGQIVYEHQLQLIEFTKKFEKVVCEFYCFTQSYNPNITFYTLNDAINRVMRIAPLGEDTMSNTWDYGQPYSELPIPSDRVFEYIDTKITNIGNNEIPQLFLDQGTLREKLDAILKTINGIAKLKSRMFGSQEQVKVLSVDLFNELKNILEDLKLDNMNDDINIEEINSNMETFLDNSVNEISQNSAQIVYPDIPNGYDSLKTSDNDYVLTDSNCGIRTEYPIYRVDSLIIPVKIAYQVSPTTEELSLDLDVTNYVIEQTDFDALPIGTDSFVIDINNIILPQTQRMYLPYVYKSNFINCGNNNKGFIFTYPNFNTMITAIATKYYIDNYVTNPNDSISLSITVGGERTGGFVKNAYETEGTISTEASFDPSVVEYRIKYTPIYDSRFGTDKNSNLQVKVNATSLENQSTRIMSFENFSNNLLSSSQRVGTQHREITIRHLHANELLQNGDYFNDTNEIITECEYIYYNNFIVGKYLLSKDYNRINEYIGINSEIRQWQVPGNVYDRKLLIKNYLEIDSEGKDNTSYLTELGCETILDNFVFDANRQIYKATNVFYDSSNTLLNLEWANIMSDDLPDYRRKILLGCVNNGGGNIISLGWTTQDNMCVTPVVETYTEGGVTKYLIKKVPYCIPNGEYMGFLRNFNFIISNKNVDAIPTNKLPFVMKRYVYNGNLWNDPNDLVRVPNMLVLKDPSERLTMNYQVSVVSNSEYITVGKWFTIDNLMIKDYDRTIPLTLDIYTSTTKHGKTFNDRVDASYTNSGHDITYYFDANCNQAGYDYSQTPRFYLQLTHHISDLFGQGIKEIVFADPDTNKIHLVIDVNYFKPTYSGGTVVLGQDTIHFNFTKKRSNLNYDY